MNKINTALVVALFTAALVGCNKTTPTPPDLVEGVGVVKEVRTHASSDCENYDYVAVLGGGQPEATLKENVEIVVPKEAVKELKAMEGSGHVIKFYYVPKRGAVSCSSTYALLSSFEVVK